MHSILPLLSSNVAEHIFSPFLVSIFNSGSPAGSHPAFRPHPMQGWSPDVVAAITESAFTPEAWWTRWCRSNGADAMRCFAGARAARRASSPASPAAQRWPAHSGGARGAGRFANLLCLLPDTGERYQSTPLFADIPADMDEEELAISRSTPGARFDAPAGRRHRRHRQRGTARVELAATAFVAQAIADPERPVVMFALEWCEFCWSLRRLFARRGAFRRSTWMRAAGGRGGQMRAALRARTGITTIPQVFVGGELVGGSIDVIEALRAGQLQSALAVSE